MRGIAASATLAIDAKAKALRLAGEDVVIFGAGEPDFPTPEPIVAAAQAACADPRNHHYTPSAGLPELREAIASATLRDSGLEVSPAQVLVTNGGKHAVANAFATLLDPGDEVILPAPYWTTYPELITLSGGIPVPVFAGEAQGFKVGVEQLERARTERTKAVVIVSPSNPSGALYGASELAEIARWAKDAGLWVVSDDIYEHLVYSERERPSITALVPELAERTVLVNGVAKTYAMTGWRVGWLVGPADFVSGAANLQSQQTANVANVSQVAALAALNGGPSLAIPMREAFDRRRKLIWGLLSEVAGVSCIEPEGAFYVFPSVKGILGREIGGVRCDSSMRLAEVLLEKEKVAVVPGEAFGAPGYLRFSYALGEEEIAEGISRFRRLVEA